MGTSWLLVAGERARDEGRAEREGEEDRIDRRLLVRFPLLRGRADVGRGGELPLGETVDAVVLQDVQHVHVAADRVRELPEPDRERVAVAGYPDVGQPAIGRRRARRHRRHAPVHGVEAVRLLHEVRRGLRRAADPAHLRGAMRLELQLPRRLHQRRRHRVVPAAGAERRHRPFVVAHGEPEAIGARAGVPHRGLGDGRHAGTPARCAETASTTTFAVSGMPP